MPKQIYKIDQFHGGLNNNSDARDIAENELSTSTDVMVDELGKVTMMGGNASQGASPIANTIWPGYGLFQFSHDRVDGHTSSAGSADPETGADYFALADADNSGGMVGVLNATQDADAASDTALGSITTIQADANTGNCDLEVFIASV